MGNFVSKSVRIIAHEPSLLVLSSVFISLFLLQAVPEMNVQWKEDGVVVQSSVDVSVAVATPTGLITPIVFGADSIGLTEISQRIRVAVFSWD